MASINNTVQPGMISANAPNAQYLGGITLNPNQPTINAQNTVNTAARTAAGLTAPVSGLVSPAHPAISAPSTSNISSHTYTTNPDGGTTTKITYAPNDSTGTGTSTTSTGGTGTTNGGATNPTPTQTPAPQTGNPYTSSVATAATPNSTQTGLVSALTGAAGGNTAIGQAAADILDKYGLLYKNIGQQGAALESGQLTTGTSPVARGNAAVTAQNVAEQQTVAAQGAQTALSGINAELTGQSQLQSGLTNALGAANVQQAQQLSGLGTAATLAQPSATSFGQTVFNPTTGQFTNNGGLPPDVMAQYAQMAANGQYSAIPSAITSNPVLSAQLNDAAKAINPNYNPIASTAQGTAQSQNITNLGTATTQGQAQVLSSIPQLTSAEAGAQSLQNNINALLQSNPQLNQSNAALANAAQQWLQGKQLGDPAYQTLFNYLQEYSNTLAPILGVGGDPTNMKTQIATSLINAQASGQSIMQVIQNLQDAAKSKISSLASGAFGGGATNTNPSDPLGLGI